MTSKPSTFSLIAKDVFREQLAESEWAKSHWTGKSNMAWCVTHLDERFVGYFIVQRTYGVRITGELAFSQGVHNPGSFFSIQQKKEPFGTRIRIGHLMGKGDLWWPCSGQPDSLKQETSELVRLLIQYSDDFFRKCKTHALQHVEA